MFRRSFVRSSTRRESLGTVSSHILCYHGELETPKWIETEQGTSILIIALCTKPWADFQIIIILDKYTVICTITAQLDELVKDLRPRMTTNDEGKTETYYLVEYDIAFLFGLTDFKASVIWEENVSVLLDQYRCN